MIMFLLVIKHLLIVLYINLMKMEVVYLYIIQSRVIYYRYIISLYNILNAHYYHFIFSIHHCFSINQIQHYHPYT